MPDLWGILSIASKLAAYLGFLWSAGLVMNRLAFVTELKSMTRSLRKLVVLSALFGIVGAGLNFVVRGAILMDDVSGMYDPSILGLLWDTPPGGALLLRSIGAGLLIIGGITGGPALWLALIGGLVSIWSFATIGHVEGAGGLWLQTILFLHLAVAAFWIGVFTPLRSLSIKEDTIAAAAKLGHKFGTIAAIVVPTLIIAGVIMSWQLVGSPDRLLTTAYGITLLVKVALVAILLGLAAANKLRFAPALETGDVNAGQALARSIQFEWVCVVGILLATAILTSVLTLPS